jgi:putative ABC transport system permease protein
VLGFALRNLYRNRVRSLLALLGLAGSSAGVVVLVALSLGARKLAREVAERSPGIFVMKAEAIPHFSRIALDLEAKLKAVPGVAAVDPEVWQIAFQIEHRGALLGAASMPTLVGVDPTKHARLRGGGVYARNMVSGRMFGPDETRGALLSLKLAKHYDRWPGSKIHVIDGDFTVTGVFKTDSPVFDGIILAHEQTVRAISEIKATSVSCFFLEGEPGQDLEALRKRVGSVLPGGLEAGTTDDWSAGGADFVAGLDAFLASIAGVAFALGALGVVNTMLMSVRERVHELGILRATGWTRSNVFDLIIVESGLLGAAGGGFGILAGSGASMIAGELLPLSPSVPFLLLGLTLVASTLLGVLGGLYPAISASRLEPMVAIRS